ncbi:hypothetical protein ACI8B_10040 [Acinetobacter proteolyticus]|uniref:Uncharacterized protein n=1 Tax=Acinetobacter proteolyticus TaxID=1776741 RepID=A0A653JZP1_9GAMM|nr:hypothetical protein ACI8B_10040 [Acinetobacter proteolyticus]
MTKLSLAIFKRTILFLLQQKPI